MLTTAALNGFKDHVKRTVAYAKYKVGSTYYDAKITDIYVKKDGKVAIDFTIDHPTSGNIKVTEVQLYNTSGILWCSKTENIERKSSQSGIFYRFTINIYEE